MKLYRIVLLLLLLLVHEQDATGVDDALQSDYYDVEDEVIEPVARQQVSVRRRRKDAFHFGSGHICSGYLIAPHVVLSAAHCFVDRSQYDGSFVSKSDVVVVLGSNNRFMDSENIQMFVLKDMLMPTPKFNLSTYSQDMALLVLHGYVCPETKSGGLSIPLADAPFPAKTSCQLIGWGRPEIIYNADFLVIMTVSLIDQQQCMQQMNTNLSWQADLHCAGFLPGQQPPEACTTDSGGPLVCNGQLAGIVSWGIKCEPDSQLPAVYTDVSYYTQWIRDVSPSLPPSLERQCFDLSNEIKQSKIQHSIQMSSNAAKLSLSIHAFYVFLSLPFHVFAHLQNV